MTPLVSIVCITYNHENYIADAIEGFLMQEVTFPIEIIIHDDASTDETANIVREYEKKYPEVIRGIYQTENQYSKGIKITSSFVYPKVNGKYIALCEGDDFWINKDKLQKQIDYMEDHPNCSVCFHDAILVDVDKGYLGPFEGTFERRAGVKNLNELIFTPTASRLFRASCVSELPEWYFRAPHGDFALMLVCSNYGYVYYLNEQLSAYRTNVPGSILYEARKRHQADPKSALPVALRRLQELNDYNEWSDYKNDQVIQDMILDQEFRILVIERNLPKLKEVKYKTCFERMGLCGRVKFWIRWYVPRNLYRGLASVKRRLVVLRNQILHWGKQISII